MSGLAPIPDESRTLLYLRRRHEARQMDRARERIEREGLTDENRSEGLRLLRQSADGHNRIRRRGVPIIRRSGVGGATPGSDPVAALLRKEARGELRR